MKYDSHPGGDAPAITIGSRLRGCDGNNIFNKSPRGSINMYSIPTYFFSNSYRNVLPMDPNCVQLCYYADNVE